VQVLGIIIGAYIVCWLPFFVLALVRQALPQPDVDVPYWLDWLTLWLGWTNSLINPFVYAVNNRDFRTPFREILCCRWTTLQSVCRWGRVATRAHPAGHKRTPKRTGSWPMNRHIAGHY
jgi:5-hydroxytryptamine receptor 7